MLYYDENQLFNAIRFGQQFASEIANPVDVVAFKKNIKRTKKFQSEPLDKQALKDAMKDDEDDRVEDVVDRYFNDIEDKKKVLLHIFQFFVCLITQT